MDYGTMDYRLWKLDYGLWTIDYRNWTMENGTMDYGLWKCFSPGSVSRHLKKNLVPNPSTYVGKAWPLKGRIHCSLRSQCYPLCQNYTIYFKKSIVHGP